jgi:hypothetical protein
MFNEEQLMFSIYLYDPDTGHMVNCIPDVPQDQWQSLAAHWHHTLNFLVKVVDQTDGCVIYTLGG